ncbi:MAG TPA: Gfo/Idh/MocA family oxidoreductase [Aggregatilineales bacterium]|nr:Gfo/Idh/MocA family oxidoreductase [Aggregatilineales bacterium]
MTNAVVVGTGFIGPVHVEALRRIGVHVRGVLGSSPEKSQQAAQSMNLEVAYPNYQAIIDDPEVHAIHITTPNDTHLSMSKQALLAGKHVICEKPLAMNAAETAELVELAKAHPNLVGAVNYNKRFYPLVQHARDMVQSGEIGEVRLTRGGYLQDWLLYDTDWNWRLVPEQGGSTRAIGDIGTHWMDLVGFITGLQITELLADLHTFIPVRRKPKQALATFAGKEAAAAAEYDEIHINTEDVGAVLFHYGNGARGTMNVSQVTAGRKNFCNFEIVGSEATLAWDVENPNHLWIGRRDRPNEVLIKDPSLMSANARYYNSYPGGHTEGFDDSFKQLYRAVYDYIHAGNYSAPKPYPTFEDGHQEVILCDRIVESHQQRGWVRV